MSSTLRAWVLSCRKRRTGFLARMLPCEKSVGGIPTRRTLSLQPCRPRRRIAVSMSSSSSSSSSFSSSSSTPPLLVFSRPPSTRRTKRPGETIVSEERERWPEQHESPRTTSKSTNERTNEGRNERARDPTRRDATFSHGMLACCEYVNIFYSTLSLGRGIKLFPPRGCRRRLALLVATTSGVPMSGELTYHKRANAFIF